LNLGEVAAMRGGAFTAIFSFLLFTKVSSITHVYMLLPLMSIWQAVNFKILQKF